jgi:pyruvate formate lyase activating enzyme
MALVQNLKIIAFTWNEPSIMPEMVVDVAKIAKKQGLTTVYVSNGSLSKKHVDLIAPYIDAFRFDIKAGPNIGDAFYRNYCRLQIDSPVKKILETIKYTKSKGKHIEILTVLIPTMTPSCIRSVINTAKWIKHNLGKETPWHLAKFIPAGELLNPSLITPDNLIDYLASVAKLQGLTKINVIKDKGCDCFIPKNVKCLDCDCCH